MKSHNLFKILIASIMLSTGLNTIAMEDASECVELVTFRASGITNDPNHIVNTFLHNQPMYQRTFATLLHGTSRLLAARTLREIPLELWALKKLNLPKNEVWFVSDSSAPLGGATSYPIDALTAVTFNDAGTLQAFGTRLGRVHIYDATANTWKDFKSPALSLGQEISSLHFTSGHNLLAINSKGQSHTWNIFAPKNNEGSLAMLPMEDTTAPNAASCAIQHAAKLKEKIDFLDHLNSDVPQLAAHDYFHGFKRKLKGHRVISDYQLDTQNGLLYLLIRSNAHDKGFIYELAHDKEFAPELRIYDVTTDSLVQSIIDDEFEAPILLHADTNRLLIKKKLCDGEKIACFDLTELLRQRTYFRREMRLEQVLLLSIIYQMERNKLKLDFNKFPNLVTHYQNLPESIKEAVEKLVIQPRKSICAIL